MANYNDTRSPAAASAIDRSDRQDERGAVLIVVLVMGLAIAALITTHLTKVLAEVKKTRVEADAQKALAVAQGQLEYAKNIVNAAPYQNNQNTALDAAVRSKPPYLPGTSVLASRIGGPASDWFMLRATGRFGSAKKIAQAIVKQRSPVSAFNFFVVDHPLGISGAPRGAIHTNKKLNFFFPNGLYRDEVTASEGFEFRAGATAANTRLQGHWDMAAEANDILAEVSASDLKSKAKTLKVTDNLIAEVEFKGKTTAVSLFNPAATVQVEKTGTRSVFSHNDSVAFLEEVKHYKTVEYDHTYDVFKTEYYYVSATRNVYNYVDVQKSRVVDVYEDVVEHYTKSVPIYEDRPVTEDVETKVWVEDPAPSMEEIEGGFAVGGSEPELGHWEWITKKVTTTKSVVVGHRDEPATRIVRKKVGSKVEFYTEREKVFSHTETYQKKESRQVKIGTRTETRTRQEYTHSTFVTKYRDKPVYRDETYTYFEPVSVPEEFVEMKTVPTEGVIYIEAQIRRLSGKINGKVSLVSNRSVTIDGSLVYVDDKDNTRMLNGSDPSKKYAHNPDFKGQSVLGIVSKGDITYGKDGPDNLEINASLISLDGKVAYDGIEINSDGTHVSAQTESLGAKAVKSSIRRLGGIVSRKRPVTSYVDSTNTVIAGYRKGMSFMDANMILKNGGNLAPPFVFLMNRPTWTLHASGRVFDPSY